MSIMAGLGRVTSPLQYGWIMFRAVLGLRKLSIFAHSLAGEFTTVGTMKMLVWFVAVVSY